MPPKIKETLYEYCKKNPDQAYLLDEFKRAGNIFNPHKISSQDARKEVWWECEHGHRWKQLIRNRTTCKNICHYCSGRYVTEGLNDLTTTHPELCKDWDYEKNIVGPEHYSKGMHDRVWWKCNKCGHEWKSQIDWRASADRGCPKCAAGNKTSFPEQVIYLWLKETLPNTQNRFIMDKTEYDIYVPELKLVVEFDGLAWHQGKEDRHLHKLNVARGAGINLLNIAECKEGDKSPLQEYTRDHTVLPYIIKGNYDNIDELIVNLATLLNKAFNVTFRPLTKNILNKAKRESRKRSTKSNSLAEHYPEFLIFWDYESNDVEPDGISRGSAEKVHWRCPECGYCWEDSVHYTVLRFTKCDYCGLKAYYYEGYIENVKPIATDIEEASILGARVRNTTYLKILRAVLLYIQKYDKGKLPLVIDNEAFTSKSKDGKVYYNITLSENKCKDPKEIQESGIYLCKKVKSKNAIGILKEIIKICGYEGKMYIRT